MNLSRELIQGWSEQALREPIYHNPIFPPSPYYRFLKVVARELKPKLSVVLGVCGGGDSLHICLGNPEGSVIGVDLSYDHPEQLSYIKSTCPNFVFWNGDSVKSAKDIFEKMGQPSLLFVDTIHEIRRTIDEFNAWESYLSKTCIVAFDDLNRIEMSGFWEWVPKPKLRLDELHSGSTEGGFGVYWRNEGE